MTGSPRCPNRVRLTLEVLEGRAVPTISPGTITVNTSALGVTDGTLITTANASSRGGTSVVAWTNQSDVYARLYDAAGSPLSGEIKVAFTNLKEYSPSVAIDGAGNFVVSWTVQRADGDKDVQAARFSSTVQQVGKTINVAHTSSIENDASVACAADGRFAVAYTRADAGTGNDVFVRRFDANGNPVATTTVARTKASEVNASVAFATGKSFPFSVAYQTGYDIALKRYDAAGKLLGTTAVASGKHKQSDPSLAMDDKGNHVVAWQEYNGDNWSIFSRPLSSGGVAGKIVTIKVGAGTYHTDDSDHINVLNYTKPSVALKPSGGAYAVTYAKYDETTITGGPNTDLDVFVSEVAATGHIVHSYDVESLAYDDVRRYTNLIHPTISIDVAGDYAIAYPGFYYFDVHLRFGKLA